MVQYYPTGFRLCISLSGVPMIDLGWAVLSMASGVFFTPMSVICHNRRSGVYYEVTVIIVALLLFG